MYIYIVIHIYILSLPEEHPGPLKAHKINIFDPSLGVPSPLETYWLPLCQIPELGDALRLEKSAFLGIMLALILQILDILKYMGVHEVIGRYLGYMKVYEGI